MIKDIPLREVLAKRVVDTLPGNPRKWDTLDFKHREPWLTIADAFISSIEERFTLVPR